VLYRRVVDEFPSSKEAPEADTWIVQLAPSGGAGPMPASGPAIAPTAITGDSSSPVDDGDEPPFYTKWYVLAGIGVAVAAVVVGAVVVASPPTTNPPPTALGNQGIF